MRLARVGDVISYVTVEIDIEEQVDDWHVCVHYANAALSI